MYEEYKEIEDVFGNGYDFGSGPVAFRIVGIFGFNPDGIVSALVPGMGYRDLLAAIEGAYPSAECFISPVDLVVEVIVVWIRGCSGKGIIGANFSEEGALWSGGCDGSLIEFL